MYAGYTIGDDSGIIVARIRDSAAHDVPTYSKVNVNDGKFQHVVFVVDRSSQTEKMYIDGSLEDTADISAVGNIGTSFNLNLGGTKSPNTETNFFDGTLDQVRVYKAALSESQIQHLFNESL